MKRILFILTTIIFTSFLSSCSIAPGVTISQQELLRSKEVSLYIIEDDIDGVLKVLNSNGEVVVNSTYFDNPVYLQIFATPVGIEIRAFDKFEVRSFDKDEYDFTD